MNEATYFLKSDVNICPFDGSTPQLTFQAYRKGRHLALSSRTAAVFEFLRTPRTQRELDEYAIAHNLNIGEQPFVKVLGQPPFSRFITTSVSEPHESEDTTQKKYLFIRWDFLAADVVSRIVRNLEFLFAPVPALVAIVCILVIHAQFVFSSAYKHPHILSFKPEQWIAVWVGAYAAVLFHEFGHCAACTRYGRKPGSIGIGLYLIWPVFYADTTDSWVLDRRHRAIVDVAGIYFHLLISAICILMGEHFSSPVLIIISKSALLSTAINLNPFFRFDGYWLITDLTGIPNIRRATSQFWRFLFRAIFDRTSRESTPQLFPFSPQLQLLFGVYCVSSLIFFGNISYHLMLLLPHRVISAPHNLEHICHLIAARPLSSRAARALLLFFLFIFGLLQAILFATRRVMRGYHSLRRVLAQLRLRDMSRGSES
ncbi:MAG TPA: hypothetical protein VGX94_06175 [Terriglobia bacterium]|nr:hypothetical protein [Terriglobia bacterium]